MVSSSGGPKDYNRFALERIIELARKHEVVAKGRARHTPASLGYSHADVCACIAALSDSNFQHSICYENGEWVDVYRTKWSVNEADRDDLFIKVSLNSKLSKVLLHSFHLPDRP